MNNTLMLTVASEINQAHAHAVHHAGTAIDFAKHAGELLLKVKGELPHGEFLPWLAVNCTVSDRQARRYMASAQGKPLPIRSIKNDTMLLLPGAVKSDTVSDLEVNDGQAIYITRQASGWQDDIVVFPDAAHIGFFHYAFISGQAGDGASCTYTKRSMSALCIRFLVTADLPNWRECTIDRIEHPGYDSNPFATDDLEQAFGNVAKPLLHKNLELARELVTQFIADAQPYAPGNQHLFNLLDSGDEYEVLALPGDALSDIVASLKTLLQLASQPLQSGNDKANRQREKITMLVRTVLALLGEK